MSLLDLLLRLKADLETFLDLPGISISNMNPPEKEVLLSDDSDKKSITSEASPAPQAVAAASQPAQAPVAAQNGMVQRQRPDQFQVSYLF